MRKRNRIIVMLLCMVLLLSGCNLRTVDQLYCLPKRTDTETDLQAVIDEAMEGLEYSAPISGANRQVTQKVDLDGDGVEECLVFACDDSDKPLKILIFCQIASGYVLMDTIEGYGFAFDSVDYVQLDGQPGLEIVVGRQVSNDVIRAVSVYRFASARSRQLLSIGCTRIYAGDLNADGLDELLLLSPGEGEESNGVLGVYAMQDGKIRNTVTMELSQKADKIKRSQLGRLSDGKNALFISSLTEDGAVQSEVFCLEEETLRRIWSAEPMESLGGYPVYAEDLDADGIPELPSLIPMNAHPDQQRQQYFVRWFTLDSQGRQQDKRSTYMNYTQGWYLTLLPAQVEQITVVTDRDTCSFYGLEDGQAPVPLLSVHTLTEENRHELVQQAGYTVLYENDTVIFAAEFASDAARYGFTPEVFQQNFYRMRTERSAQEN